MKKTAKRKPAVKKGPLKATEPDYQISARLEGIELAIERLKDPRSRGIVGPKEAASILRELRSEVLEDGLAREEAEDGEPDAAEFRERAAADGIEVDSNAVVSRSQRGAYVMAWVWVDAEEGD